MNRILTLAFTATLLLPTLAHAGELDGEWVWRLDSKLDGRLAPSETHEVSLRLEGSKLIGTSGRNIYSGEIVDGDTTLVVFQEIRKGYVGVMTGVLASVDGNWRIVGTWYDTKGNTGDFEMVKK